MRRMEVAVGVLCAWCACFAQVPDVAPKVVGRAASDGQVTLVHLVPRFATVIRMTDAVNSVILGDPEEFSAEHSDREPRIVVVKPITAKAAQTNLLITTVQGYQANLLLISHGEPRDGVKADVDFMLGYRPTGRFVIDPTYPSALVARTTPMERITESARGSRPASNERPAVMPISAASDSLPSSASMDPPAKEGSPGLDALLERQRHAPMPVLYGEKPGIVPPGGDVLKAGVSEVLDRGREVVVLFSVVNLQPHAIELMPPQVQLGGKVRKGKIVHHTVWSTSEQLPVQDFRVSRIRIGPGERADGVLVFQRPSFKQSTETLLLQIADSGAVDRPALAPIGFGISTVRKEGGD
jgi:hypothetical protein